MPPNPNGFIFSTTADFLPIRTPVDSVNLIFMAWKI